MHPRDDLFSTGVVIDDVLNLIKNADYLIADLTGRNPNVYYELGFAHSQKKKVVMITQSIGDVPFDLRNQRMIEYRDTIAGADALKTTLGQFLANL